MNAEDQKRELAKLDGWTAIEDAKGFWRASRDGVLTSALWILEQNVWSAGIPDFLNDLNAVHELEKKLKTNKAEWRVYQKHLLWLPSYGAFATAAQRCEAILKVKGLWR